MVNNKHTVLISKSRKPKMNTSIHLNNLENKLVKMKNYIISLTHEIDQVLEDINNIKESLDPENMFQGIPTCELTMITKDELERKKEEDIFNSTRIIVDKYQTTIIKIPLIATDSSLIQARSRRVATSAVIFGENSTLNDTAVCPDSTSSTTPEIMAIIEG